MFASDFQLQDVDHFPDLQQDVSIHVLYSLENSGIHLSMQLWNSHFRIAFK